MLTVANLGSNRYGYDGAQGGLTDTAFTYLSDDTPISMNVPMIVTDCAAACLRSY